MNVLWSPDPAVWVRAPVWTPCCVHGTLHSHTTYLPPGVFMSAGEFNAAVKGEGGGEGRGYTATDLIVTNYSP